jgi:hypothetical protein
MNRSTMALVHPGLGLRRAVRPHLRVMTRLMAACLGQRGEWVRASRALRAVHLPHADVYASILFLRDHGLVDARLRRTGWEVRLHTDDRPAAP